jgi:hypothetical protein
MLFLFSKKFTRILYRRTLSPRAQVQHLLNLHFDRFRSVFFAVGNALATYGKNALRRLQQLLFPLESPSFTPSSFSKQPCFINDL